MLYSATTKPGSKCVQLVFHFHHPHKTTTRTFTHWNGIWRGSDSVDSSCNRSVAEVVLLVWRMIYTNVVILLTISCIFCWLMDVSSGCGCGPAAGGDVGQWLWEQHHRLISMAAFDLLIRSLFSGLAHRDQRGPGTISSDQAAVEEPVNTKINWTNCVQSCWNESGRVSSRETERCSRTLETRKTGQTSMKTKESQIKRNTQQKH